MLLRRVPQLPEGPEWQYEVKWDGYRMQAIKQSQTVQLVTRSGADFTRRFPQVAEAVARLKPSAVHLDGELVVIDPQGRPSFQVLQAGLPLPTGWSLGYYAFDLLHVGKRSLHGQMLLERREKLAEVLSGSRLRFSSALRGNAKKIVKMVTEHRLEGVVAKRLNSLYETGKRSGSWVKLPCKQKRQFLIGGYRPTANGFGKILVGHHEGSHFKFAGKVRHRLESPGRFALMNAFKRLRIGNCPFSNLPNCRADPFDEMVTAEEMSSFAWLEPELSVPVAFQEWTRMNVLRQAELAV